MARSVAIPASMRRALAELKAGPVKGKEAHLGAILMPAPLSLDEWESYAVPMQAALMQASSDDHAQAETAPAQAATDGSLLSTTTQARTAWIRS
jgi:hypothetical protein